MGSVRLSAWRLFRLQSLLNSTSPRAREEHRRNQSQLTWLHKLFRFLLNSPRRSSVFGLATELLKRVNFRKSATKMTSKFQLRLSTSHQRLSIVALTSSLMTTKLSAQILYKARMSQALKIPLAWRTSLPNKPSSTLYAFWSPIQMAYHSGSFMSPSRLPLLLTGKARRLVNSK